MCIIGKEEEDRMYTVFVWSPQNRSFLSRLECSCSGRSAKLRHVKNTETNITGNSAILFPLWEGGIFRKVCPRWTLGAWDF